MIVFALVGLQIGLYLGTQFPGQENLRWILALVLAGSALGLLVTPYLTVHPYRWMSYRVRRLAIDELLAGAGGLAGGLVLALLLTPALSRLPGPLGVWLPLATALMLGYFCATIAVLRVDDLASVLALLAPGGARRQARAESNNYIVLDTSAIIDGRIADLSRTGFLRSTLLVPRFVLDELQQVADSSDALKRNRGRRGLDILSRLQADAVVPVKIADTDIPEALEVDAKLVRLAQTMQSPILTNDFNLKRVAEIQGVAVLFINDLANAVKSVVLPGEEISLRIIHDGKEAGQGVGYLDDGTMVVVEGGRRFVNSQVEVVVTRELQTVGGRLVFAQPKGSGAR